MSQGNDQRLMIAALPANASGEGSSSERAVEQPRQPTSLQGLLRFAMDATADDVPLESGLSPLEEEVGQIVIYNTTVYVSINCIFLQRKKFLENAIKSMTIDVIDSLQKSINILIDSDKLKLDSDISEHLAAFEIILEHVDMIDTAIDFHKIGGFTIFPPCLNCVRTEIRTYACNVLAELCQNNPYCQQIVSGTDLMEQLLHLLDKDEEYSVQIKALYAISCNIREFDEGRARFLALRGLRVVFRAFQRPNEKLLMKATFLLDYIITREGPKVREELIRMDIIPVLAHHIMQERKPSHQYILSLMWLLVLDNPAALDIYTNPELDLARILDNHITAHITKEECKVKMLEI